MIYPLRFTRSLLNPRCNPLSFSIITNKVTSTSMTVKHMLTRAKYESALSFRHFITHRCKWFPKINGNITIEQLQNKSQLRSSIRIFSSTATLKYDVNMVEQSRIRYNFEKECEDRLNCQINMELFAGYVYLSMASYFDRDGVSLPGFHAYFLRAAQEEVEHAKAFMTYLNKRGGKTVLTAISEPPTNDWESPVKAMEAALDLEKDVNEALLTLHVVAGKYNDANLCDFLEANFLQHQIESIKEISDHLTNIERAGEGLGIFLYDKELYKTVTSSKPH